MSCSGLGVFYLFHVRVHGHACIISCIGYAKCDLCGGIFKCLFIYAFSLCIGIALGFICWVEFIYILSGSLDLEFATYINR